MTPTIRGKPPRGKNQLEAWLREQSAWYPDIGKMFDRVKAGDVETADQMVTVLNNEHRGQFVRWCVMSKLPVPLLRVVIQTTWNHDDREMCKAAGRSAGTLYSWFKAADFPLPSGLPDPVTVYRGTSGIGAKLAPDGVSWTLDKRIAAWFACTYRPRGEPLVLRRVAPLRDVLMYDNDRNEQELVIFNRWLPTTIDGDPDEWRRLALEYQNRTSDWIGEPILDEMMGRAA
jgi:hypothetical protein